MRLLTTQLTVQLTLSALSRRPFAERARKRELKKARKLAKEAFDLHLDWERRVRLDQPFTSISPSTRLRGAWRRTARTTDTAEMMRADEEEGDDEEGEGESDEEEEDEAPMDAWFRRHRLNGGGGAGGGGGTCGGA